MKHGYSMVLREHVPCEDVGYGDCKEFQIVCPACQGAVYKTGTLDCDRQFLSHHPGTGLDDCELRVKRMMESIKTGVGSEERNQSLALFQSQLIENYIQYHILPKHPPEKHGHIIEKTKAEFDAARRRPSYQLYLRSLQSGHARGILAHGDKITNLMIESATAEEKTAVITQAAYIHDFLAHMESDRTGKVFVNITTLALLNAHGMGVTQVSAVHAEKMMQLRTAFYNGSEKEFKRAFKTAKKMLVVAEGQNTSALNLIDHDLAVGIISTLSIYPFIEAKMHLANSYSDTTSIVREGAIPPG